MLFRSTYDDFCVVIVNSLVYETSSVSLNRRNSPVSLGIHIFASQRDAGYHLGCGVIDGCLNSCEKFPPLLVCFWNTEGCDSFDERGGVDDAPGSVNLIPMTVSTTVA